MSGAGLLFLTNLVAIVTSAFLVFLLVGMNTTAVRESIVLSRAEEPLARSLSHSPLARMFEAGGQLRWRILMLSVMLASIAVPLGRALLQVANDTRIRGSIQDGLKRLVPPDAIVSQQVTVGKDDIVIRLISTRRIPDAKMDEVRQELMRRTGQVVRLSVDAVASKSELADLMERLARPAPITPKEMPIREIQKELVERVRPALEEIWPLSDAPIQEFELILGAHGMVIQVRYEAGKDLGEVPIGMVLQSLRSKLQTADLTLNAERIRPKAESKNLLDAAKKRKR